METMSPEELATANHESFIEINSLDEKSSYENSIIGLYFAFTTLSTVGFGDYTPRGDVER